MMNAQGYAHSVALVHCITDRDGQPQLPSIVWSRTMAHIAQNKLPSAVMVLAFAGPWSAALNDAVGAAVKAGVTVVTSAGKGPQRRHVPMG
jgi:hypothetical protein